MNQFLTVTTSSFSRQPGLPRNDKFLIANNTFSLQPDHSRINKFLCNNQFLLTTPAKCPPYPGGNSQLRHRPDPLITDTAGRLTISQPEWNGISSRKWPRSEIYSSRTILPEEVWVSFIGKLMYLLWGIIFSLSVLICEKSIGSSIPWIVLGKKRSKCAVFENLVSLVTQRTRHRGECPCRPRSIMSVSDTTILWSMQYVSDTIYDVLVGKIIWTNKYFWLVGTKGILFFFFQ